MPTARQLTHMIQASANPAEAELAMWKRTRYLVTQRPSADDYVETNDRYYKGHYVIPGPLANERLTGALAVHDLAILKEDHNIQFTDNHTTDGADESVRNGLLTIMSDAEANDFERILEDQKNGSKAVPSKAVK